MEKKIRKIAKKSIVKRVGTLALTFVMALGTFHLPGQAAEHRSRPFLNTPAATYTGPERDVFRVIEVIPHDACSFIPYLVDWKTVKGYNDNVPIGYEGLMAIARGEKVNTFYQDGDLANAMHGTNPKGMLYTRIQWAQKETFFETLDAYNVAMDSPAPGNYDYSGNWYRQTDPKDEIVTSDGYFEYVGEGYVDHLVNSWSNSWESIPQRHGLYYISTTYATGLYNGKNSPDKGINHQLTVVERKSADSPKGELCVESPAYYLANEHSDTAIPYNGAEIESQTDYNYNLTFSKSDVGNYRADLSKANNQANSGRNLEYLVELAGTPEEINKWTGGFAYTDKGGNLAVASAVEDNANGAYVRDSTGDDGYTGLPHGHFRLYQASDTGKRYDVTFTNQTTTGNYYAEQPANSKWSEAGCEFSFVYYKEVPGCEKGVYDVPFIYDELGGDEIKYIHANPEVTVGKGRYALTATKSEQNDKGETIPIYTDKASGPKDYIRLITNINWTNEVHKNNGNDSDDQPGVSLGGSGTPNTEYGCWVFRPVSDKDKMETTKLSAVYKKLEDKASNTKFKRGDKIYVTNQKYVTRYYGRDGFRNNELLKLLGIFTNPEAPEDEPSTPVGEDFGFGILENGVGYRWDESPLWNVLENKAAKELLQTFDNNNRIEIIQRSFSQLMPAEVRDADLIFMSRSGGLEGMRQNIWNDIIIKESRDNNGPEIDRIEDDDILSTQYQNLLFKIKDDLRADTLYALFDQCVVQRKVALMLEFKNFASENEGIYPDTNLEKLIFLLFAFQDGRAFQYFIEGYDARIDYFTRINIADEKSGATLKDGSLTLWEKQDNSYPYFHYNVEPEDNKSFPEKLLDKSAKWDPKYFHGAKVSDTKSLNFVSKDSFSANVNKEPGSFIDEGQSYMGLGEYAPNQFIRALARTDKYNLYSILNNSSDKDSYKISLTPTNAEAIWAADGSAVAKWVIYGNEFDATSFDIIVKGEKSGVPLTEVQLNSLEWKFEDEGDTMWRGMGPSDASNSVSSPDGSVRRFRFNVRSGFQSADPTLLNPGVQHWNVVIRGKDSKVTSEQLTVEVIVRDTFNLN